MRTTLDIGDDVLAAAKEQARVQGSTAGEVLTRWVRQHLTARTGGEVTVAGFRPLPSRGVVVTNDQINAIREAEGI